MTIRAPNPTGSAHSGWPKAGWFSFAFSIKDKEATTYEVCVLCVKWPCDKASTPRAPAASSARLGRPKMKLELIQQPDGREAGVEFEDKCVGSVGCTKGAAAPKQAHGEALLESAQVEDSDSSVHAPFVKTETTGWACSTGSLTARVAYILEHSADSEKAGARHEPDKEGHLDSDTGMLKLWEVEDNRVLKAKEDAQDSGRHGNYTVSELNGQLKAMLKLELKAKMPVKTELHKHLLKLGVVVNKEAHDRLCSLMLTLGVVEYTRVRTVRAGVQGLDLHGNHKNIYSFDKVDLDSGGGKQCAFGKVQGSGGKQCAFGNVQGPGGKQ